MKLEKLFVVVMTAMFFMVGCAVSDSAKKQESEEWNPYTTPIPEEKMPPIIVPDGRDKTLIPEAGPKVLLTPMSSGLPQIGLWRQNLALADMNGDGHIDVVAGPPRGSHSEKHPFIFAGNGKGEWKEWTASYPHGYYQYGGVDAGDVNGDGLLDIAYTGHYAPSYVLLQVEEGKFEHLSEGLPDGNEYSSRTAKLVNLDADSDLELILLADTSTNKAQQPIIGNLQRCFDLDSEGKIWSEQKEGLNNEAYGDRLVAADFNMDGLLDFAVSNHIHRSKNILFYQTARGWQNASMYSLPSNAYTFDIALADLNGDPRPDLVLSQVVVLPVVSTKTTRKLYHRSLILGCTNTEQGWVVKDIAYLSTHIFFQAVAVADFDGNGLDDIAAFQKEGQLYLFMNYPDGYKSAEIGEWPYEGRPYWASAADADEDGRADLFVAYGGEKGTGGIYSFRLDFK